MSSLLSYKNYNGTVEYSKADNCLYGKVIGVKSLLSYEGDSVRELEADFRSVIDEYLKDCEERGLQPELPYKGTFNVRISPDLHRTIATYAIEHGKSLNAAVEEAIEHMLVKNNFWMWVKRQGGESIFRTASLLLTPHRHLT